MLVQVFSVFDNKVGAFAQPFFSATIASAVRAFSEIASDRSTQIGKHVADFHLFHLGSFDDVSGAFESIKPVNLGAAASFALVGPAEC